ncbi:MAG: L,D-transpeptidase family protein [Acidobacteriaceae bacterium]
MNSLVVPRRTLVVPAIALCLICCISGCRKHRGSTDLATNVQHVVNSPQLAILKWSNYSDFQPQVKQFYDARDWALAWTEDGQLTSQADEIIQAFSNSAQKGLKPEDYDASRWPQRIERIKAIDRSHDTSAAAQDQLAQFDAAMTITAMRYISNLHSGRVNPQHLNFDIDVPAKRAAFDLATFLNDHVVEADDVGGELDAIEPQNAMYAGTERALQQYLALAKQQHATPSAPLSTIARPVSVDQPFPASALYPLASRLALEGDMPSPPAGLSTVGSIYTQDFADAVKHYQQRHGLTADGKLTQSTIASLNVPMDVRVQQLNLSLERWRWLDDTYVNPRLLENLAEFVVRAYEPDHSLAFKMKTVNGQAKGGHDTPIFTRTMKYVVFRPYWNVPPSIIKKELLGHIQRSGVGYLAEKNYEVTTSDGTPVANFSAKDIEHLRYAIREKPGPKNSLGLVKFMFPNEYDVYMHSTPEINLFGLTRRDRSHGCVRLEHADQMAAWVLRDQGDWDPDKIADAMNSEDKDNKTAGLKTPLPVVIFYLTATADEDGTIHFFDDIYDYDKQLQEFLDKGMPYPSSPAKINPKLTPGETV